MEDFLYTPTALPQEKTNTPKPGAKTISETEQNGTRAFLFFTAFSGDPNAGGKEVQ